MHTAIERNDVAKVRALLKGKANPNLRKDTRASPTFLTQAARLGREEIVSLLIQSGADVDGLDGDAMTPLMWASWNGHIKVVMLLIKAGADVNDQDKRGDSVLHYAMLGKNTEIIAALRKAGAK
jgi:ankyrin repeat protein